MVEDVLPYKTMLTVNAMAVKAAIDLSPGAHGVLVHAGPQNILAKCSGVVRGRGEGGRLLVDNKISNDPHQE